VKKPLPGREHTNKRYAKPSAFVQWLTEVSRAVAALTDLLEQVAGLLRQLVKVVGWLVLLLAPFGLLLQPHLSPEHLITPGAGALAVLQGLIKPRQRQGGQTSIPGELLEPTALNSPDELVIEDLAPRCWAPRTSTSSSPTRSARSIGFCPIFRRTIAFAALATLFNALDRVGFNVHLPSIKFVRPRTSIAAGTTTDTDGGPWVLQKMRGSPGPLWARRTSTSSSPTRSRRASASGRAGIPARSTRWAARRRTWT
jgi:hypothetical protein